MRITIPQIIENNQPYKGYVFELETPGRIALVKYSSVKGSKSLTEEVIETFLTEEVFKFVNDGKVHNFYALIRKNYTNKKPFAVRANIADYVSIPHR